MADKRTVDRTRQALIAAIAAAAEHRRANPSAWSRDGYLIRFAGIAAGLG